MRRWVGLCSISMFVIGTFYSLSAVADCAVADPADGWYDTRCQTPLSWENDDTEAYVGTDPNYYNTQWIGWHNLRTGECLWDQIGDGNGFSFDTTLVGFYGNDYFGPVYGTGFTFCGYYIDPPIYGSGHLYYDMAQYNGDNGGGDHIYNDDHASNMYGNSFSGTEYYTETVDVNVVGGTVPDAVWIDGSGAFGGTIYTYEGDDGVYIEQYNGWVYPSGSSHNIVSCGGQAGDAYCGPDRPSDCPTVGFFCGGEGGG